MSTARNLSPTWQPGELSPDSTGYGSLSSVLGFDTLPIRVHPDGAVTTVRDANRPGACCGPDGDEWLDDSDWEWFSTGYTGQYGYAGPIMHASEMLTGSLARDILASPGVYAAVIVEADLDDSGDSDPEPAGWAIVKLKGSDE